MHTHPVKKLKCLSCDALARLVYCCAAQSPHVVDIELFELGLHQRPADLRQQLQARIDAVAAGAYDAIVLAYGLCGKATAGLTARHVPLVIPRAHDCITLFLGSRARYAQEFETTPGTYWYVQDYIERNQSPGAALSLGATTAADMHAVYDEYVVKYGQDNADYLMTVMGAWQQHYQRAVYIDLNLTPDSPVEQQARDEAAQRGWTFERLTGDPRLIRKLLHGDWDDDLLRLEPGQRIEMTYDDAVMGDSG
jgi:hypothetical protein